MSGAEIVPAAVGIANAVGIGTSGANNVTMPEPPPPPPSPAEQPDPENVLLKRRKQREAAATARKGGSRASTLLSNAINEKLGG